MEKRFKIYMGIWLLMCIIFNLCVFIKAEPSRDALYWVEYVLIMISFLSNMGGVYIIGRNKMSIGKKGIFPVIMITGSMAVCAAGVISGTADILGIAEPIACMTVFLISVFALINCALMASMMSYAKKALKGKESKTGK